MPKIALTPVVDVASTGRATASSSLARQLQSEPIAYTQGYAYLVPAQYAHELPSQTEGFAPSKRVYAAEFAIVNGKLKPTGNLTAIKLSSINQTFLAVVSEEPAPVIACELNDAGAYRPKPGQATYNRAVEGLRGLALDGENVKVRYPIIYWAEKQERVYVPQFDQDDTVNHTMLVDDDENLELAQANIQIWRTEAAATRDLQGYVLRDIVPADLPNLADLVVE